MVFFRFKNKKTANEIVLVAGFSLSILIERRSFLLHGNADNFVEISIPVEKKRPVFN